MLAEGRGDAIPPVRVEYRDRFIDATTVSEKPKPTESSELEELNQWLADPILCKEVMAKVMRSARYTVEFDELGEPMRVVEMRG